MEDKKIIEAVQTLSNLVQEMKNKFDTLGQGFKEANEVFSSPEFIQAYGIISRALDSFGAPKLEKQSWVSDSVDTTWYDAETKSLYVKFNNGRIYLYQNVSKYVWTEMKDYSGIGKFIAKHIKGKYSYIEVTGKVDFFI